MFNISSIYPKKEGYRFDFDYYLNRHMPMSIEKLSGAKGFQAVSVERGVDIDHPRIESSYVAMCHYYFDSLENFMLAFTPHADVLQGDIKNYTNIEPVIQINEVTLRLIRPGQISMPPS
ncbi:MAG: EthD family reductase [Candidatus Manganitrophaceae bacterium]